MLAIIIIIITIQKVQDRVYTGVGCVEAPDNTFLKALLTFRRRGEEPVLRGSRKCVGMDWREGALGALKGCC